MKKFSVSHLALMCAGLAAFTIGTPATAQQQAGEPVESDVIVVLADDDSPINPVRLPQSARVSSQTFNAEDIERLQPRDTFDLLNYGTGVFATTTGKKAPSNLNIRGDGNYAFVIDGAYYPAFLASRVLQSIPTMAIEEVRIVRTSTALTVNPLVGLAAPSGAANNGFIVVRTREPRETTRLLRGFVGEHGAYGASGLWGTEFDVGAGTGFISATGNYATTDGPDGYNLDRTSGSLLLRGGYSGERFSIDLTAFQDSTEFGFQRSTRILQDSTYFARWRMDPLETTTVSLNSSYRWNDANTTLLNVAHTESEGTYIQESYQNASRTVLGNDNTIFNAGLRHNLFLGDTRFQGGVDYVRWHTPTGQFYYEGIEREEEVFGVFLQADRSLFDDRLNLDVGVRQDQVTIITGIDYYSPGRQPTNPVQIFDRELPEAHFVSAGASFRIAPQWIINARYGYSDQGARTDVTPYPGVVLEGESREKFEIGFEGELARWFAPSINYFQVETTNEAAPRDYVMVSGVQIARYDNTDSKRTGIEAVFSGSWGDDGRDGEYRFGVTHFFDVLDPSGLLARTQPETVAELTLNQNWGRWRFGLASKYVAEYESNAFGRCATPTGVCPSGVPAPYLPIGDYFRTDLSVSRQFEAGGHPLRLTLSVKNVTDDLYETTLGYPDVGRVVGLELLTRF